MMELKTAEWVSPKHPDKMCDQIADAILDAYLKQDPDARVAVEVTGGHGQVFITGEVTSKFTLTQDEIKDIVQRISGIDSGTLNIKEQSPEIANGVDTGGAGDQGIMVGYATIDNEDMIPQELYLARDLGKFIYRKYPFDGKTQVTLDGDGKIQTVVVSFQNVKGKDLRGEVAQWYAESGILKEGEEPRPFTIHANPAGDWKQGGFDADAGTTGRKLAVDNYGPQIPIGGGAFSGKDSTKVDRSGAYMARKIAVDLIKETGVREALVKIAYAIGEPQPVMVTALIDGKEKDITGQYDLTPQAIINQLELNKPQFERLAREGHFGTGNIWDK